MLAQMVGTRDKKQIYRKVRELRDQDNKILVSPTRKNNRFLESENTLYREALNKYFMC